VGAAGVNALTMPGLQVGIAGRPLFGEERSGDMAVSLPFPGGALVGAVDGLGHGDAAAAASAAALEALSKHPEADLGSLFARCDAALVGTRGAVMTLVSFDFGAGTITWFGVGNVEARLVRADAAARADAPMLLGGVVGQSMPSVRASNQRLRRGDMLMLATDGVGPEFSRGRHHGSVDRIASRILVDHGRIEDDALVVVARYLGSTISSEA
jgi:negative regulator of sigma-B (phosphoserine phosphatase)